MYAWVAHYERTIPARSSGDYEFTLADSEEEAWRRLCFAAMSQRVLCGPPDGCHNSVRRLTGITKKKLALVSERFLAEFPGYAPPTAPCGRMPRTRAASAPTDDSAGRMNKKP